eukprot:TRINITY_DN4595_c0_g1_i6.p1 TRINITY_DN4595_c0_g1~~TRINITY_DN4595_c0_g1_i6.p1  ORF type:complete len:217 (+),score=60.96 TRINITY_DN4595_c0_g1_i6:112-762(+)
MIRRPPRSTHCISSAASDVYKRQYQRRVHGDILIGSMVFIGIWIAGTIFFAYYVTIRTKEPQYKAENKRYCISYICKLKYIYHSFFFQGRKGEGQITFICEVKSLQTFLQIILFSLFYIIFIFFFTVFRILFINNNELFFFFFFFFFYFFLNFFYQQQLIFFFFFYIMIYQISVAVVSVAIAVFCLWLMWICTYLHQMFPLLLPQRIQENKSSLIL